MNLVSIILLGIGGVSCFYGYRVFRFWLFVIGFLIGGLIGLFAGTALTEGAAIYGFGLIGGIAGGFLFTFLYHAAYYIFGGILGASLSFILGTALINSLPLACIFFIGGFIIGGRLALYSLKLFIIGTTSVSGAFVIVHAIVLMSSQTVWLDIGSIITEPFFLPMWARVVWALLSGIGFVYQFGGISQMQTELQQLQKRLRTGVKRGGTGADQVYAEPISLQEQVSQLLASIRALPETFPATLASIPDRAKNARNSARYPGLMIEVLKMVIFLVAVLSAFGAMESGNLLLAGVWLLLLLATFLLMLFVIRQHRKHGYRALLFLSAAWLLFNIVMVVSGASAELFLLTAATTAILVFEKRIRPYFTYESNRGDPVTSRYGNLWDGGDNESV